MMLVSAEREDPRLIVAKLFSKYFDLGYDYQDWPNLNQGDLNQ